MILSVKKKVLGEMYGKHSCKNKKMAVVPVVVIKEAADAEALAEALIAGGIPCAEVTYRTDAAEEAIRRINMKYPEMLLGAGTVLTKKQIDSAVAAGAKFVVSPGFDPEIVDYCIEKEIAVFPGCMTPSELAQAAKRGLKTVKFFPSEQAGGISMIEAVAAPYPEMRFMATGGINPQNLKEYLSCDKILCCGGSWMVKEKLIAEKKFGEIQELVRQTRSLIDQIRGQERLSYQ